jgi:hypothetical protein
MPITDPRPLVSDDAGGDEMTPNLLAQATAARPYGAHTFSDGPTVALEHRHGDAPREPVVLAQLLDHVAARRASGDIGDALGEDLRLTLRHAEMYLDEGRADGACLELERVLNMLGAESGQEISAAAAGDLAAEATALSADLGC